MPSLVISVLLWIFGVVFTLINELAVTALFTVGPFVLMAGGLICCGLCCYGCVYGVA